MCLFYSHFSRNEKKKRKQKEERKGVKELWRNWGREEEKNQLRTKFIYAIVVPLSLAVLISFSNKFSDVFRDRKQNDTERRFTKNFQQHFSGFGSIGQYGCFKSKLY